jgi:tripartite-type tricarboxylate transporter receptor subunit TctC
MMRFAALLLFGLVVTPGLAADYPARPIRLIVPYPPGGTLDVLARGIGPELTTQLGQPIVIENRSGAAGAIGTEAAAKAAPDGYTLLIGGGSGTAVHALLRNVPYDPVKAFSPIGTLATYPSVRSSTLERR